MLEASILSAITDALTELIGDHGIYAVFVLMFVDALLPAASELVMVYAGAVAAGAFAGQSVVLFGEPIESKLLGVRRNGLRRRARLHPRLDRRLGDRLLRRAAVRRAARAVVARHAAHAATGPRRGSTASATGRSRSDG